MKANKATHGAPRKPPSRPNETENHHVDHNHYYQCHCQKATSAVLLTALLNGVRTDLAGVDPIVLDGTSFAHHRSLRPCPDHDARGRQHYDHVMRPR